MAKVKIMLRRNGPKDEAQRKFDVKRLQDPNMRQDFNIAVQNRFSVLSID